MRATASPAITGAVSRSPVSRARANSAMTFSRRISSSSRPSHRCVCVFAKHRPVKGCGHTLFARDIEDDATHRFVSGSGHDALLCRIPAGGLHARIKARSHDDALRAQHDACSQAPPISSTASKQNWNLVADRIHDRRDERERALRNPVATCFAALCHDDVGTLCHGIEGHF